MKKILPVFCCGILLLGGSAVFAAACDSEKCTFEMTYHAGSGGANGSFTSAPALPYTLTPPTSSVIPDPGSTVSVDLSCSLTNYVNGTGTVTIDYEYNTGNGAEKGTPIILTNGNSKFQRYTLSDPKVIPNFKITKFSVLGNTSQANFTIYCNAEYGQV